MIARIGLLAALAGLALSAGQAQQPKQTLRIGVSARMSEHLDPDTVREGMKGLRKLAEEETGHPTVAEIEPDWRNLLAELKAGKRDLVGLTGFEYAWARAADAKIMPLMIVVNETPLQVVHVLTRKAAPLAQLADLGGKKVAIAKSARPHCGLYLERQLEQLGKSVGERTAPGNTEDAIDDVVDGLVDAVVVEAVAVDAYRRRKPGRFAQLKEIARSEPFPSSVVAYYQGGGLDERTLAQLREGMLNLNETVDGRRLLTLWKLTAYANVPHDFDKLAAETARAYPAKK